jgi:hypothetical protein
VSENAFERKRLEVRRFRDALIASRSHVGSRLFTALLARRFAGRDGAMAITLRLALACVLFAVTLQRARAVNSSLSVLTLCTGCNATLHLSLNFSVGDREFSAVYSQVFSEATRSWIRFRRPVAVTVRRSFQGIEFELRATGSFFRAWELAESSPGCLFASRGAGAVALSGCNNASSAPPRDLGAKCGASRHRRVPHAALADFPEADGFELCCFGGASRPEGERRCLRYDYSAPLTMHRVLRLREHQFFEVASSALSGRVRTRAHTRACPRQLAPRSIASIARSRLSSL